MVSSLINVYIYIHILVVYQCVYIINIIYIYMWIINVNIYIYTICIYRSMYSLDFEDFGFRLPTGSGWW